MGRPVRIQLSRKKGFDLQALSHATNGLEAINVARPSKWGNPFKIGAPYPTAEEAVATFRHMLRKHGYWWPRPLPWPKGKIPAGEPTTVEDVVRELRGKNLACWCKIGDPCHADVLLELANRPICEEVACPCASCVENRRIKSGGRCYACNDTRTVPSASGEMRPCSRCRDDEFSAWIDKSRRVIRREGVA